MSEIHPSQMTIDEFVEFIQSSVRNIGAGFTEPDDDWMPVMFMVSHDGVQMAGVVIPSDPTLKRYVFLHAIPTMVRELNPGGIQRMAFVTSSWTLPTPEAYEEYQESEMVSMAEHPEHEEMVSAVVADRDGELRMTTAKIYRDDEQPPALQEWETHDGTDFTNFTGNVMDMLRRCLR